MSERELNRIEVLSRVTQGRMTAVTAANVLGLSRRQVHRLLKTFQADGPAAIRHKAGGWHAMAASVLPDEPDPIFTDPPLTWASAYLTEGTAPRALKPQGGFSTSLEGAADLDGSVWEWTQECHAGTGDGVDPLRCPALLVGGCAVGTPPAHLGMRLVSDDPLC